MPNGYQITLGGVQFDRHGPYMVTDIKRKGERIGVVESHLLSPSGRVWNPVSGEVDR